MKRLFLVRHGEAQLAPGQREGDRFSMGDLPLSARGAQQARATAELLRDARVDAVYTSPLVRARETAAIVAAPHGLAPEVADGLREFPLATPGMDYPTALAAIQAFPDQARAKGDGPLPGGSTYGAEQARFARAVDAIVARHDAAIVVAHGIANRAYLARVLELPAHALFRIATPHASVMALRWEGRGPVLVALNPGWRPDGA